MTLAISKQEAITLIKENQEIIQDKQKRLEKEQSKFARNLLNTQILNRRTIIKALENHLKP